MRQRLEAEHTQQEARAVLVSNAWRQARETGPEKLEEDEEAKEKRRIQKARLRGRRTNLQPQDQEEMQAKLQVMLPASQAGTDPGEREDRKQDRIAPDPEPEPVPEPEPDLGKEPEPEPEPRKPREVWTAEDAFKACLDSGGEEAYRTCTGYPEAHAPVVFDYRSYQYL